MDIIVKFTYLKQLKTKNKHYENVKRIYSRISRIC